MRISARPSRRHDAWSHRGISEAEPFGLNAEPVLAGEILTKWSGAEAQIEAESQVLARCRGGAFWCPRAAQHFLAIVDEDRERNGRARIGVINREINLSIVATTDLAQWGVADRWSAPLETFTTERGDCEDYAIAKYVALSATGVSQQDICSWSCATMQPGNPMRWSPSDSTATGSFSTTAGWRCCATARCGALRRCSNSTATEPTATVARVSSGSS